MTTAETISFVEKLIASGKGDLGRLNHILIMLKQGRKLYHSDQKYLDAKLAQEIGIEQKPKIEETLLMEIKKLASEGQGDVGRLQFILESLTLGKTIYHSDQKYLESKLGHKLDQQDIQPKQDDAKIIEGLKSQVTLANKKITHLELVLSGKVSQLQKIQDNPTQKIVTRTIGAMPKGWQQLSVTEEINKIQKQISIEQVKLDKEKNGSERLRIEQSKLMQIILDRQEFEKQVQIEQEQLTKQMEQERQSVSQQTKLLAQIKSKEAELEDAKKERDRINEQLQKEQIRLTEGITAQKTSLSEVKDEYDRIASEVKRQEQEVVKQVEQERLRLSEQLIVAKKIQTQKEHLENIRNEYQKIIQQTKSQEHDLAEQLKREKDKVAQKEKLLRSVSNYEKYILSSKQKQTTITAKIEEQKKKLHDASPSISQIKEDYVLLDQIIVERTHLEKQIKFAESELQYIKKEKSKIERQLKNQKSIIAKTKKQEIQRVKHLKQKKMHLTNEIKTETTKIKKIAKKL